MPCRDHFGLSEPVGLLLSHQDGRQSCAMLPGLPCESCRPRGFCPHSWVFVNSHLPFRKSVILMVARKDLKAGCIARLNTSKFTLKSDASWFQKPAVGVCGGTGSGTGAFSGNIGSININRATAVQDFICLCCVITTQPGELSPVGTAEGMRETTLPQGAPDPGTRALTHSSCPFSPTTCTSPWGCSSSASALAHLGHQS